VETRFATTIFRAHGITDFLNAGFVRLREGPATSLSRQPSDQGDV